MLVRDIGEFKLIDKLTDILDTQNPAKLHGLVNPVGDDAAAWITREGFSAITTDTLVEGVHFIREITCWNDLGWKCIAVNLSDIAAMGCEPTYSTVTLGLRGDIPIQGLLDMYRGMVDASRCYGGILVGGDVVKSDTFFVSITMLGESENSDQPLLSRRSAKVGDRIALTGQVGSSAGGLRVSRGSSFPKVDGIDRLLRAYSRPEPRVLEGQLLRKHGVVAAIDVSDGLVDDLRKLCRASNVGARVQAVKIPVDKSLKAAFPNEWRQLSLSGGEDYEILFTASQPIIDTVTDVLKTEVTIIGEIVELEKGTAVINEDGAQIIDQTGGWDHFKISPIE